MNNRIGFDPFWDGKAGGGVRCSVDGVAANQYQDPATQFFEGNGGRSIASLLPGRLRGVIVPRATTFGGSRGFDPQKPRLMNIDPDIKGQSCVVDLSQISKEKMEEAFIDAAQNPIATQDIRLLAAQTFHNLAVGYDPVGQTPAQGPRLVDRRSPLGDFGSYVVPRAGLGGGQVLDEPQEEEQAPQDMMSPSITPRSGPVIDPAIIKRANMQPRVRTGDDFRNMQSNVGLTPPPMRETDEYGIPLGGEAAQEEPMDGYQIPQRPITQKAARQGFVDQSPPQPRTMKPAPRAVKISGPPPEVQMPTQNTANSVTAPETRVTFEIEGWGEFEAMYHEVIKNDCVLVLVFDTRFKGGGKYFPPSTDKIMAVKVDGQDTVYFVHSYGTRFKHGGFEYCMLVIDQDAPVQEEET